MAIPDRAQKLDPSGAAAIPPATSTPPVPPPPSSGRRPPQIPRDGRAFGELRDTGLLHLINREVFHPRGYALALVMRGDDAVGWDLLGDGSEPWTFAHDGTDHLARAEATMRAAAEA